MDKYEPIDELIDAFTEAVFYDDDTESDAAGRLLKRLMEKNAMIFSIRQGHEKFMPTNDRHGAVFYFQNTIRHYLTSGKWKSNLSFNQLLKEARQYVDALTVTTETIVSLNVIEVQVADTGYQGGDAGHGAFVSLHIKDLAGTCMEINGECVEEFTITFRGDSERKTFVEALEIAVSAIKKKGL
jgi:hypothetical protein